MYSQFAKKSQASVAHPSNSASRKASANRAPNGKNVSTVKAQQPYRSINTYLDRITIAGVHNYLYARGKYEKTAWNVTCVLAIIGTIYYLVSTVQEYLEATIVLDIQYQTEPAVRLPNPWICHFAVNVTYIRGELEKAKPALEADKRVQLLAQRYQRYWNQSYPVTTAELMSILLGFIIAVPTGPQESDAKVDYIQNLPQFAIEMLSKAIRARGSDWPGVKAYYEAGMHDCKTIVKRCTLNGEAFDCCREDPAGYNRLLDKCFLLNIRNLAQERKLQRNQTEAIELEFETIIMDPSSDHGMKGHNYDGGTIVSFGNRAAGLFDYTLNLEGGSVSSITVKGTKKKKLTNCMDAYKYRAQLHSNTHPIIREYFEDMATSKDRYSVAACQQGKLFEVLFSKCGCVPYLDYMRPQNDTDICTPAHSSACIFIAFQNEPITDASPDRGSATGVKPSTKSTPEDAAKRDLFHDLKELVSAECFELCESWNYDYTVFSTGIDELEGNTSSINRTKVTIVFDPEYRVETEVYKMDPDAFFASLGDALGLILGFSVVTLIQLPVWSIVACLFKRKQNKVSALMTRVSKQDK